MPLQIDRIVRNANRRMILSWAWIIACAFASLATLAINAHDPFYFNCDAASETVLANTLLKTGHLFATPEFFYSTEVQFFSSQLFLEVGLALFGGNWLLARLVGTLLLMAALVASYRFVARQLGIWERARWVAGLLLLPFGHYYTIFFIYGTYYMPELCMQFLAIGMCLYAMKRDVHAPALVATAILGFGFGVNGYRTTLLCFAPAILSVCLCKVLECKGATLADRLRTLASGPKSWIACVATLGVSSVLGTLFNMVVLGLGQVLEFSQFGYVGLEPFKLSGFLDLLSSGFVEAWGYEGVARLLSVEGVAAFLSLLVALAVFVATCACVARRTSLDEYQRCFVMYLILMLFMTCSMYYLGNYQFPHYLTIAVIPFLVTIPLALKSVGRDKLLEGMVAFLVMGAMVVQSISMWYKPSLEHWLSHQPYPKEKMVAWLVDNGFSQGYSTFWNANDVIEISDGKLDVWAFGDSHEGGSASDLWLTDLAIKPWLQERRHAEQEPEGRVFLILQDFERDQVLASGRNIGNPVATFEGDERVSESDVHKDPENYSVYAFDSAAQLKSTLRGL